MQTWYVCGTDNSHCRQPELCWWSDQLNVTSVKMQVLKYGLLCVYLGRPSKSSAYFDYECFTLLFFNMPWSFLVFISKMLLEGLCPLPSAWLAAPGKAGALTVSLMHSRQSVQLGQKKFEISWRASLPIRKNTGIHGINILIWIIANIFFSLHT